MRKYICIYIYTYIQIHLFVFLLILSHPAEPLHPLNEADLPKNSLPLAPCRSQEERVGAPEPLEWSLSALINMGLALSSRPFNGSCSWNPPSLGQIWSNPKKITNSLQGHSWHDYTTIYSSCLCMGCGKGREASTASVEALGCCGTRQVKPILVLGHGSLWILYTAVSKDGCKKESQMQ